MSCHFFIATIENIYHTFNFNDKQVGFFLFCSCFMHLLCWNQISKPACENSARLNSVPTAACIGPHFFVQGSIIDSNLVPCTKTYQ